MEGSVVPPPVTSSPTITRSSTDSVDKEPQSEVTPSNNNTNNKDVSLIDIEISSAAESTKETKKKQKRTSKGNIPVDYEKGDIADDGEEPEVELEYEDDEGVKVVIKKDYIIRLSFELLRFNRVVIMGSNNDLYCNESLIIGDNNKVTGKHNIIIGKNNRTRNDSSFCFLQGEDLEIAGSYHFVLASNSKIIGSFIQVFGYKNVAQGMNGTLTGTVKAINGCYYKLVGSIEGKGRGLTGSNIEQEHISETALSDIMVKIMTKFELMKERRKAALEGRKPKPYEKMPEEDGRNPLHEQFKGTFKPNKHQTFNFNGSQSEEEEEEEEEEDDDGDKDEDKKDSMVTGIATTTTTTTTIPTRFVHSGSGQMNIGFTSMKPATVSYSPPAASHPSGIVRNMVINHSGNGVQSNYTDHRGFVSENTAVGADGKRTTIVFINGIRQLTEGEKREQEEEEKRAKKEETKKKKRKVEPEETPPPLPSSLRLVSKKAKVEEPKKVSKLPVDFKGDLIKVTADDDDKAGICRVCTEYKANATVLPCSHLCMCMPCAAKVATPAGSKCPICSVVITKINGVYIS